MDLQVFEIETLSSDTFFMPSMHGLNAPTWNENPMTGRVTCSVPFSTADGRGLVAIGCAEGVWIGLRHDPKCVLLRLFFLTVHYPDLSRSIAPGVAFEDGDSVCHARGLRYFPGSGRQGMASIRK